MTLEQERIERLEKALHRLVWFRIFGRFGEPEGWCSSVGEDENVDDIIGDLLDKYKPTKETSEPTASEAGWIPWNGGESAPAEVEFKQVLVRLRDGVVPAKVQAGWLWDWTHYSGENDIIAYKVVD